MQTKKLNFLQTEQADVARFANVPRAFDAHAVDMWQV